MKNGKPRKLIDHSMESRYHDVDEQVGAEIDGDVEGGGEARLGEHAFEDLTGEDLDCPFWLIV